VILTARGEPALAAAASAHVVSLRRLDELLGDANGYYGRQSYRLDDCAHGRELHPQLVAAFADFDRTDAALDASQTDLEDRAIAARLARLSGDPTRHADLVTETVLDHLEGATLRLSVALEAFCRAARKLPHDVRADETAWSKWTTAHADEIRALGVNAERGEELARRVAGLWKGDPTSRLVERYFEAAGVPLPREVVRALSDARNLVAHQYRVSKAAYSDDFEDELKQIALVRTCLVAALAIEIGYAGPITDGDADDTAPSWWPAGPPHPPSPHMFRCEVSG
jgi:hypothetical protein